MFVLTDIYKKQYKIGPIIKERRKEKNLTQEELAEKLGKLRQTIGSWERGDSYPTLEDLCRLSDIFQCDVKHLLGEFSEKTETKHNICSITHLSEKALDNSLDLFTINKGYPEAFKTLNSLLENSNFILLLKKITAYKADLPKYIDTPQADYSLFGIQQDFNRLIDDITDIQKIRKSKTESKKSQSRLF